MTSLDRSDGVSQEEAAAPGVVHRWRAFSLLAVAYLMTAVDLTIVNVALPTIGVKLHFPQADLLFVAVPACWNGSAAAPLPVLGPSAALRAGSACHRRPGAL